ncbi:MAG: acyl-CoA dehydrogenase family protein [Acidimicrobiia bacterium]|nr:acyl-CoA dehydrogenase family protein [Acidimicrobiia bacterium]
MYEWSEEHKMIRDAVRDFVEKEVRPQREELEFGDTPPYAVIRKLYSTFGMDEMARGSFAKRIAKDKGESQAKAEGDSESSGPGAGFMLLPIIELCRCSPGLVTAMGVSTGLAAGTIMSRGTVAQKERWALDLLTFEKVGAWAITESDSGSDAFGRMASSAKRDGEEYILNGSKTFITNGPYADTTVFICKLDEGNPPEQRKILSFVLDRGMPGFEQTGPMRKMGMHSSPTGMLFLTDVRVTKDRLLGETEDKPYREGAKEAFSIERTGVAAMSLGIIDRCLELSLEYAKTCVRFGKPIGEHQLIQEKLARMETHRLNVENMVFRTIEKSAAGASMTLSEASVMKLYSARAAMEVALEAVQLHGGNGYMAEFEVEQLARDAKVLQIYAGTDEIQISQIARNLLA